MRKRGGLPQHPGDGTRIAEVSTCEFDDRHVKPGETVSYAVLAKRGEAESLAAVAAGPVIFLPDVQDVRVEPRDGRGRAVVDPSARGVRDPRGPQAGALRRRVPATAIGSRRRSTRPSTRDSARDQVYHYGIYAIYRQPDGHRYPSPGVVVAAIPAFAARPASQPPG